MTYATLEHVAEEARAYPTSLLAGSSTGLVLFSAAFLGHNDAIHFAEAGIRTTCVDVDGPRLAEMAQLYPNDWQWAVDDAWKYADHAYAHGEKWDVVSADPFTGDAMRQVLDSLELWCSIANRHVIVGVTDDLIGYALIPAGWRVVTYHTRAASVYWLILERGEPV